MSGSNPLPSNAFNDGLRKLAGFAGQLLFAAGKAAFTAMVKDACACEWDLDQIRIRKIKHHDGRVAFVVFDPHHADGPNQRLDQDGKWQQCPHGNSSFRDYIAEWREDTEFETFDEAARIAAEYLKENGPSAHPGGFAQGDARSASGGKS